MGSGYNPYRNKNGQFGFGPKKERRIQYAQSDERGDALAAQVDSQQEQIQRQNAEAKKLAELEKQKDIDKKIQEIEKEIKSWEDLQKDIHSSPFLREKSFKELSKLKAKLRKLQQGGK